MKLLLAIVASMFAGACSDDGRGKPPTNAAAASSGARCQQVQAMLAVERPYVVDRYTPLASSAAQPIPLADADLLPPSGAGIDDELGAGAIDARRRVYLAVRPDLPVARVAAWLAAQPDDLDARLIVQLGPEARLTRFRAAHPEVDDELATTLMRTASVEHAAQPIVAAAGGCIAARAGFGAMRTGDATGAGKAIAAGLAACGCATADLDRFAYLTAWLLEPRVGWVALDRTAIAGGAEPDATIEFAVARGFR